MAGTRGITVVAGMGGGTVIPNAVDHREIESWAVLTDTRPHPWEVRTLLALDRAYLAERNGKGPGRQDQALGNYCNGTELEKCRRMLGAQLERACSTCPD